MKVKDLISKLEKYDDDLDVIVIGETDNDCPDVNVIEVSDRETMFPVLCKYYGGNAVFLIAKK